jgi:hypothetical protein
MRQVSDLALYIACTITSLRRPPPIRVGRTKHSDSLGLSLPDICSEGMRDLLTRNYEVAHMSRVYRITTVVVPLFLRLA